MSNATEAFQDLQDQLAHSDKNLWLGQLVWYGVSGVLVKHSYGSPEEEAEARKQGEGPTLTQALAANGLHAYIPRLPSDVDVFRRCCTKAQKKRVPNTFTGGWDNYLLRDLPMDGQYVHKVLVRETVKPGKLSYETQLSNLTYDKSTGTVSHQPVNGDVVAKQIVDDILVAYAEERGSLNSHAVRELIRKMLLDSHAVNVRGDGGGLYFVPKDEQTFFERLEGFAAMLPGRVEMGSHPVLDDSKRREMLRRAFLAEVDEEVDKVVLEISTMELEGRKVSPARIESYLRQFTAVQEKVAEYDELLQTTHDTAHSALNIFQRQLLRLSTLVAIPD